MQKTLLYEYKDLGRAFQEIREFWEEELPLEGTVKRFLEEMMAGERAEYLSAQPRERTGTPAGGGQRATTAGTWGPSEGSSGASGFRE